MDTAGKCEFLGMGKYKPRNRYQLKLQQITEHLRKNKNQSNSVRCNGLIKYSVSVSTEMQILILHSFCKKKKVVLCIPSKWLWTVRETCRTHTLTGRIEKLNTEKIRLQSAARPSCCELTLLPTTRPLCSQSNTININRYAVESPLVISASCLCRCGGSVR